jgi:hypothetical protein
LIRNIVFDIGWVFLHLNPKPILDFLAEHGCDTTMIEDVAARIVLDDHESGRLHGHGLLERLQSLTVRPVTTEQVHAKWVDMFELQPAMVKGQDPERPPPRACGSRAARRAHGRPDAGQPAAAEGAARAGCAGAGGAAGDRQPRQGNPADHGHRGQLADGR